MFKIMVSRQFEGEGMSLTRISSGPDLWQLVTLPIESRERKSPILQEVRLKVVNRMHWQGTDEPT